MSDQFQLKDEYLPSYGDLTELNTSRLILDTVGKSTLEEIANNLLGLLETSIAIYEANGDYALGIFSSSYCQFLDNASRRLCNTEDNVTALNSGKWLCHENCWNKAALESIKTKKPVDIKCRGGLRLYAIPILTDGKAVGSISIGYGDPPTDPEKLQQISHLYQVDFDKLDRVANEYTSYPLQIINAAKSQVGISAKFIGQIIEREQAVKALQESEERFRQLAENIREVFYVSNLEVPEMMYISPGYETIWGRSRERLYANPFSFLESIHPENQDRVKRSLDLQLQGENTEEIYRIFRPDKTIRWIRDRAFPIRDEKGHVFRVVGIAEDITEQKRTEELLIETNEQLGHLLATSNAIIFRCEPYGDYPATFITDNVKEILGYEPEEFVKESSFWADHIHPDDTPRVFEELPALFENDFHIHEYRFLHKNGSYRWMLDHLKLIKDTEGNPKDIIGTFIDITERRLLEEELRDSEKRFRLILDNLPVLISYVDSDKRYRQVNKKYEEWFGKPRSQIVGKTVRELLGEKNYEKILPRINKALSGEFMSYEDVIELPNGEKRFYFSRNIPHLDKEQKVSGYFVMVEDITKRKQAEEELREREVEYNYLYNNLSDAAFIIGLDGHFLHANKIAQTRLGYNMDEFIQMTPADINSPDYASGFAERFQKTIHSGYFRHETVHVTKEGIHIPTEIIGSLITYKGRNAVLALARDITERKKAEEALKKVHDELERRVYERTNELKKTHEQLRHAEKLSAIGKLSASIAHEFNNPLYGIQNVIEGIKRKVSLEEKLQQLIDLALSECDRVKKLIKSLQDFNRPSSGIKESIDIHTLLDDMILMVKKEYKNRHITIEKKFASELPKVLVIPDQIKQVFLNLLTNAKEAIIDDSGKVTITTESLDSQIVIRINDTGEGIAPDDLPHIFDPFFTTKSAVKGTGLGLSVSYGIIKGHGGDIQIDSVPGKGATFSVILPLFESTDDETEHIVS